MRCRREVSTRVFVAEQIGDVIAEQHSGEEPVVALSSAVPVLVPTTRRTSSAHSSGV